MRSRKKTKNEIAFENIFALRGMLFIIFTIIYSSFSQADEMKFTFKSPSFSGIATSAHYLTIENQENTRKQSIADALKAAADEAERDLNNSTLARFIRNLESRVYAKLSQQLVDNLFGETSSTAGTIELEGNKIDYVSDDTTITLTITDADGGETIITFPLDSFTF